MQNKRSNQTNKVLTSHCKRKLIMVCFMAFSCKRENIDRCLGLDVSAPAPGSLTGLLCLVVMPAQDHFSENVFGFHLPLCNFFSLPALWLPLSVCPLLYTHELLGMKDGGSKEQEEAEEEEREEEDRVKWERSTQ